MLNNNNYYPAVIKKVITAFGLLFSEVRIQRITSSETIATSGLVTQLINVPIAYAPKEHWLSRIESEPELKNNTAITLPRLSFEITSYSYDSTRKINKLNKMHFKDVSADVIRTQFAPVPYNLEITLYLITKTIEDGLSVMEQILPIFSPDYTLNINSIPEMNIVDSIPIILNGVTVDDSYESDFLTTRTIVHTFNFTVKVNLYGNVRIQKRIEKVAVNMNDEKIYYGGKDIDTSTYFDSWNTTGNIPSNF